MGYKREAVIQTMCTIDEYRQEGDRLLVGGVAFAGSRGIRQVQVRADDSEWSNAEIEPALSRYSWIRYKAALAVSNNVSRIQARAMDGNGIWQAEEEIPMFPGGVAGPTVRKLSI
jgi:hypothetical protein